ncbi:MAG: DUF1080 domain-containing protein [Candidatus Nealsonbacteria bacterium]|nr:DUF1080 domain-containing protein [Candidatus Nealsonbacteria bacterium]
MIRPLLSALMLSTLFAATLSAADAEEGFVSMFNGKDLTGWEGKPDGWTVEDGAITGRSTKEKPCPTAHYLMWRTDKPADFELRLSYRIVVGNSGIQFRSREIPNWDTRGYQADLEAGPTWSGALFEHARGGIAMRGTKVVIAADGTKQVTKVADSNELQKKIKPNEWNEYRVIARGPEITLSINGVVMAQATDRDAKQAARDGVIALQMHPGPPMTVQFKDLRIKILKLEEGR